MLVYLGQETEPEDLHAFLGIGMRREFGQFDEDQLQPFDDTVRMLLMDQRIIMVIARKLRFEHFVD